MKVDEMGESGWKWIKLDESGWNGWKWMKVDKVAYEFDRTHEGCWECPPAWVLVGPGLGRPWAVARTGSLDPTAPPSASTNRFRARESHLSRDLLWFNVNVESSILGPWTFDGSNWGVWVTFWSIGGSGRFVAAATSSGLLTTPPTHAAVSTWEPPG